MEFGSEKDTDLSRSESGDDEREGLVLDVGGALCITDVDGRVVARPEDDLIVTKNANAFASLHGHVPLRTIIIHELF